jgi:hypothetical protein
MTDRSDQINALHAEYVRLTGFKISVMGREWAWFEWIKREMGIPELRMLVAEKRRRIRACELTVQSLAFRNLVGNVDFAEEDVAELRARNRGRAPSVPGRDSVLQQTGRPEAIQKAETKPVGEIAKRLTSDPDAAAKAFAAFQKLKDEIK